jgi:hypothetical protein
MDNLLTNTWGRVGIEVNGDTASIVNPVPFIIVPKAPNQTMKTFTGIITTSTTATTSATLYTVTAGKTFYLTDVAFCNNSANPSQVSVNASASLNTAPIIIGHAISTAPFELTNIGTEPSVAAGTPITAQAGLTTVATVCTYFVAGYEQ